MQVSIPEPDLETGLISHKRLYGMAVEMLENHPVLKSSVELILLSLL